MGDRNYGNRKVQRTGEAIISHFMEAQRAQHLFGVQCQDGTLTIPHEPCHLLIIRLCTMSCTLCLCVLSN